MHARDQRFLSMNQSKTSWGSVKTTGDELIKYFFSFDDVSHGGKSS